MLFELFSKKFKGKTDLGTVKSLQRKNKKAMEGVKLDERAQRAYDYWKKVMKKADKRLD